MSALYRIQQGVRALFAFAQTPDYALSDTYLTQKQRELLLRLNRGEQLHSLRVLRDVLAQETNTPHDLAVAALLHDCGKSLYPMAIWQKTLAVLARKFMPGTYVQWSNDDPKKAISRGPVVAECHPAWGAKLVAETEASERVLWLIAHHADEVSNWHGHPHCDLLKRLQLADDAN